ASNIATALERRNKGSLLLMRVRILYHTSCFRILKSRIHILQLGIAICFDFPAFNAFVGQV
ncbi:MAG: hypothetical protein LBB22_00570, partial [Treponema sp.]|nr:hypothetical protein [Treponema sp.]